jgi:sugar lactone lactonase YvrE
MVQNAELVINSKCLLGEGALWDHRRKRLLFVDIEKHLLYLYDPVADKLRSIETGQRIGTVVPKQDGRLLVALEKSVAVLDLDTETAETVLEVEPDLPHNRFNDGKCDPAGRFWVGTMAMDMKEGNAGLYRIDPDYKIKRMLPGVSISNGIAWSRDHTRLYYIDTPSRKVDCFDYDHHTGDISQRRTIIEVPEAMGYPDGMTIDTEGCLWIAMFGGAAVTCWSPEERRLIASHPIPANNVTSCTFGGEALDELYITTARIQMTAEDSSKYPQAGGVFRFKPGVRGLPCYEFKN